MVKKTLAYAILLLVALATFPTANAAGELGCGWATENIVRSGATNENAAVYAKTYTVDAGVTVTSSTQTGIIICAAESITINGELTVAGRGGAGGAVGGNAGTAAFGGGGGGPSACAIPPTTVAGGTAGAAATHTLDIVRQMLIGFGHDTASSTQAYGAGGGGSRTGTTTNVCAGGGGGGSFVSGAAGAASPSGATTGVAGTGTAGGAGGGWIVLIAPTINVGTSGIISCDGVDAADVSTVPSNSGGGGGGAGGWCWLKAKRVENRGTITANGGDGGNGGGTGATGGAGGTPTNAPAAGTTPSNGGAGGGGGAAGMVQIQAETFYDAFEAWYRLDETSGTTADDAGFNDIDGTLTNFGPSPWVSGKINNALSFDGADDRVTIPANDLWDAGYGFTIEAWANPDTFPASGGHMIVVQKGSDHSGGWGMHITLTNTSGTTQWAARTVTAGVSQTVLGTLDPPTVGEWDHLEAVYNAEQRLLIFYINGVEQGTAATNPPPLTHNGIATIGTQEIAGPAYQRFFDGLIDEVKFRNTARTATEVNFDYQIGTASGGSGTDGFDSLVTTTAESPGGNCADGGRKVTTGLDNGDGAGTERDGTLHVDEVDHTAYVCDGADGATGADGDDGFNSLVKTTVEAPGGNCATGGIKVESGLDDDRDNVLDAGEVDDTEYVCNGATGATGSAGAAGDDGHNALVTTTTEAPGANCATGGQRVDSGTDDGQGAGNPDDGVLHVDEIDDTGYACNGATGNEGPAGDDGLDGTDGDDGYHCWDTDMDRVNDAGEDTNGDTFFTTEDCQGEDGEAGPPGSAGADGHNTLHTFTTENPGINCAAGGVLVKSGLDDGQGSGEPDDGVLHADEVDASGYVCHGQTGATGPQGPQGPAGESTANCDEGNCTGNFTVEAQGSLVDLPGYTDAEVGGILLFGALLLLALWRRWWFVAGCASFGFLANVSHLPEQWTIISLLFLFCALWLELWAANKKVAQDPNG